MPFNFYHATPLLLPANPWFIITTLGLALLWSLSPMPNLVGVDMLRIVLLFWAVHQPRYIGLGTAFGLGLLIDSATGSMLGQYALAFVLMTYIANALSRRIVDRPMWQQWLHILSLLIFVQLLIFGLGVLWQEGIWPSFIFYASPIVTGILWPPLSRILLTPQRRTTPTDDIRPL